MSKSKKSPLISILVNCLNGEEFLHYAIKSIIKQTYKNWEIIFFDNNSSDNSLKIIKKFRNKKIKIFRNKTKSIFSLYKARNIALEKAKGDFVAFLDTDDTWNKNKLSLQVNTLKKNPTANIFYSNYHILFQKNKKRILKFKKKLPSGFILKDLLKDYFIGLNTLLIKKEIFKNYKFNEKYNIIGDFDLLIKLSFKFKIIASQKSLANYRIHKSNFSKNIKMYIKELIKWKRRNREKFLIKRLSFSSINIYIFKLWIRLIIFKIFKYNLN